MQISDSEKFVMDVLWNTSPLNAKNIIERLDPKLEWHEKTVKTLLNRLLKKQAISYQKHGREYLYSPVLKQSDYISGASQSFINKVFNGSVTSLVAAFAKDEKLTSQDVSELKKLLKDIDND